MSVIKPGPRLPALGPPCYTSGVSREKAKRVEQVPLYYLHILQMRERRAIVEQVCPEAQPPLCLEESVPGYSFSPRRVEWRVPCGDGVRMIAKTEGPPWPH